MQVIEVAIDEESLRGTSKRRKKSGCANYAYRCPVSRNSQPDMVGRLESDFDSNITLVSLSHCVLLPHRSRFAGAIYNHHQNPRWQAKCSQIIARPKNDKKGAQQLVREDQ